MLEETRTTRGIMKEDVLKVKDVVYNVLKDDPKTRSNDKWLIIEVLRKMNFNVYIPYDKLDDMPAFESITRCRRKIQETQFPAEGSVQEKRIEEEAHMRKIHEWI